MHVHSHYSDGSDSIEDVLQQASLNGVKHLSFVDHDTVENYAEARALAAKYEINVIPGVEISAYDYCRNRKVHVLGYHYRPEAVHIKAICEPLLRRRHAHSLWQIKQIKAAGFHLDEEKIIETAKPSKTIYKQHIMKHLTDEPFFSPGYKRLYRKLFKGAGIAAGDIKYIDIFDAVRAIVADGGIAVIAHPGQLDSYELIPELVDEGLGGIERHHPDHTSEDLSKIDRLAEKYHLLVTGGSDYHGTFGTPIKIGDYTSSVNKLLK